YNTHTPTHPHIEVLCKTLAVGICGSDIHYLKEGRCGNFVVKEPMVLGHETAAEIIAVGSNVDNFKPGDRVAVEPTVPCEKCEWCLNNKYNLCPNVTCHATPPFHGTLQHYFIHPAKYCFKVPDSLSAEQAALVEPLAVAVHGCHRVPITKNSTVLVTGAGPIGLLVMATAKAYGAKRVVVTEINEYRLGLARKMGADETLLFDRNTTEQQMIDRICEAFDGNLPDITLECSGVGVNFRVVMLSTKPGGHCMMIGIGPADYNLPIATASAREITILGAFRYQNCFPEAIDLLASGRVKVDGLISHRFEFKDSLEAYETAAAGKGIKIVIKL
ncbi:sorbitol dehydrogenase-like protein, partial [Euroglyphus maynei]